MQTLFRPEAVAHATQRLDGDVLLPAPFVIWGTAAFVVAVLAIGAWFAATASYTPTESVEGWLAPDGGTTRAVSRRDGLVLAVMIDEGDVVGAGTPLARVGSPPIGRREASTLDLSQSSEGTYNNPVEGGLSGAAFDADAQGTAPDVAVQALVVAARALRDIAELSERGLDGSSHGSVEDGDHIVAAPISGRIDALIARKGQYISRGSTVALVAASDKLIAEIDVPSHVAGLITNGQGLRLKYEGLPLGRQGEQQGIVTHVSRARLAPDAYAHAPVPATNPVYRARVRLPAQEIDVGGVRLGLRAGMRLTAEIPAPRRTLLQTLYETIR